MTVVWTEQALARLLEIQDYVAANDPAAAAALIARLVARGASLRRLWQRGRTLPELPASTLRELLEGRYRIVYRVRGKRVEIVTVFAGERRFPHDDVG